jgi:heme-degrading monooxygenase HmoA
VGQEAPLIAVIFEVWPADGQRDAYLDYAARLRPALEAMDGFISVERFQSITDPDKMLSLSIWRDEAAVANWRKHVGHRGVQKLGRDGVFKDYRLRVAGVMRDYGLSERRGEAPSDSRDAFGM